MKELTTPFLFLLLAMFCLSCQAQETEAQKLERELQEQAQKMQDSLMNTDQMKDMVNMLEEAKKEMEQTNVEEDKPVAASKASTSHLDDYVITNNSTKKFDNWQYGAGDIIMLRPNFNGSPTEHKVGTINANGSFDFTLPEKMVCEVNIDKFFKCNYAELPAETAYTNPKTGISYVQGLLIYQNGKSIGNLSLATSKQQDYNNSPHAQHRGDPGYRLEYWYSESEASAKVNCKRIMGDNQETQIVYDLDFKPGWNLMKTEIAASYSDQLYKIKKNSIVSSLPNDARWIFGYYPY